MVNETKKQQVRALINDIKEAPIVGVVNLQSLPAQQLQTMRALLLGNGVKIIMARKKLLLLALKESKKENIDQLAQRIKGMPALIFSKSNPFSLYATLQKNKSEAPAKAGQIVPKDVVIKSGPTNFAPGPIISELASVGIKTKVEGGKLAIIDDVTVAKEGAVVSPKLAETLKRLDIKPMQIGLDLVAVWENGLVFDAKQLAIDETEYLNNFTQAAQWAFNLAMEVAYPTSDTTELLVQKAFREAKALALEQNILTEETAGDILAKIERQALSLKDTAGIDVGPAKVKETKPAEQRSEPEEKEQAVEQSSKPTKEQTKDESSPATEAPQKGAPESDQSVIRQVAEASQNSSSDIPSAEDLIKATKDHFAGKAKNEQPISAEKLVEEERETAAKEKPQPDSAVEDAENLFEKLKKDGTLRK